MERLSEMDFLDGQRIINKRVAGGFTSFYKQYLEAFPNDSDECSAVDDLLEAGGYYASGQEISFEEAIEEGLTVFARDLKIPLIVWMKTL